MKKSAYSAAAVTVLGTGVGLAEETSSGPTSKPLIRVYTATCPVTSGPDGWTHGGPAEFNSGVPAPPAESPPSFPTPALPAIDPIGPNDAPGYVLTMSQNTVTDKNGTVSMTFSGGTRQKVTLPNGRDTYYYVFTATYTWTY